MDPADNENKNEESTLNKEPQAVVLRKEPERDLIEWQAPSRPFKKRDRQFYVTTFAIAGIISLILFLAEGVMPVLLIISLVFLYYVLSTVEPELVNYKITSKGIKIEGKLTEWQVLKNFWFMKRFDSDLLVFNTAMIPGRIEMVVNKENIQNLKKEISAYVVFEEIAPSGIDKLIEWFAKRMPGNN